MQQTSKKDFALRQRKPLSTGEYGRSQNVQRYGQPREVNMVVMTLSRMPLTG